jgi:hypothetical protein
MSKAGTRKSLGRTRILVTTVAGAAVFFSGCGTVNSPRGHVSNPLTPEQSKAQVVDAAREIVAATNLHVVSASFERASCNDDGVAPFRGVVSISYPLAPGFEQSDAEVAKMVQHLQSLGWTSDPDFHSHGSVLKKNSVVAVFGSQDASTPFRGIDIYGECLDMTTTKGTKGSAEAIALS